MITVILTDIFSCPMLYLISMNLPHGGVASDIMQIFFSRHGRLFHTRYIYIACHM